MAASFRETRQYERTILRERAVLLRGDTSINGMAPRRSACRFPAPAAGRRARPDAQPEAPIGRYLAFGFAAIALFVIAYLISMKM